MVNRDAFSGPDVSSTPIPPDLYQVRVEFRVKRVGWGPQSIVLTFNDPEGEAEEHLLALWGIWHAGVMAEYTKTGIDPPDVS